MIDPHLTNKTAIITGGNNLNEIDTAIARAFSRRLIPFVY